MVTQPGLTCWATTTRLCGYSGWVVQGEVEPAIGAVGVMGEDKPGRVVLSLESHGLVAAEAAHDELFWGTHDARGYALSWKVIKTTARGCLKSLKLVNLSL